jgi:TonB-dependent SusC/RagA subfamily outer membrane receptor
MISRRLPHPLSPWALALAACVLVGCAPGGKGTSGGDPKPAASGTKSSSSTVTDANGRSMAELLQGKFPGVQVFQAPGGGIQIRIRNAGTFNGGGEPLYVLDGMPLQNNPDGLLFIDPGTIAKIEVLKDVGSTAIYGIQGANGVVKITTKK